MAAAVAVRRRRIGADDAGMAEVVTTAIVFPVLLLLVMMVVQMGLWMHARQVAHLAAEDGLAQAQADGGSAQAGKAEAQAALGRNGPNLLQHPSVTAIRDTGSNTASVEVDASVVSLVPFMHLPVREKVAGPLERFVPFPGGFANAEASVGGNSRVGGAP